MSLHHLIFLLFAGLMLTASPVHANCTLAAYVAEATPDSQFTDNGDGTVTHYKTGLTWSRCAEGQTWTGSTCTGGGVGMSWSNALVQGRNSSFAGYRDWRLPNVKELNSLVETACTSAFAVGPLINTSQFPNAPNQSAWSSSTHYSQQDYAWVVDFASGYLYLASKLLNLSHVRLVRGGQSLGGGSLGAFDAASAGKALTISSINSGSNPRTHSAFNVTVTSNSNVTANTAVTLLKNTGMGNLGGTTTCTINTGTNTCTVIGATWDTAESNVRLVANAEGFTSERSAPFSVVDSVSISAGFRNTCFVTNAGGLRCTRGTMGGSVGYLPGFSSGVLSVSVSKLGGHACLLTTSGGVKCWGQNAYGQLGDGTNIDRTSPVDVVGLGSGAIAVAAGYEHSCALMGDGTVKCWGQNNQGQLGNNTLTSQVSPVNVQGLSPGIVSVTAGVNHSCAINNTGGNPDAQCWGGNESGQLGDGTLTRRTLPVVVNDQTLKNYGAIASGFATTCAGRLDIQNLNQGVIECWGSNGSGQLGDGTLTNRNRPTPVSGISSTARVTSLDTGSHHACAIIEGTVKCWGSNNFGQLGDGTVIERSTPVPVFGLGSGWVAVTTGQFHSCAAHALGDVKCWGENFYGQLGDVTTVQRLLPVTSQLGLRVRAPDAPTLLNVVAVNGLARVSFSAPVDAGGMPISGYTARCTPVGGGASVSANGTGSPITVNGLVNGTTYTCSVSATNGVGTGASSPASAPLTPVAAPPAVQGDVGTGPITATVSGTAGCGFASHSFTATPPAPPPTGVSFPHGWFDFTLRGCFGTATVTLTYPTSAASLEYWKYGRQSGSGTPGWYRLATGTGNSIAVTFTDGGLGDDDGAVNGEIRDPGGVVFAAAGLGADAHPIPTLGGWGLALLSLALLVAGVCRRQTKPGV